MSTPPTPSPVPFLPRLILVALAIAGIVIAARWLPLDGVAHGGNLRLLGRLHPLLVHFPIVLLILVSLLELVGRRYAMLRDAAGFVLGLAVPCAIVAVFAGLALARADGHEGALLVAHLKGGVVVAIGTALAWLLRGYFRVGYALVLVFTLMTLAWAAHNGGSLTHGADYLTEPLPAFVKAALHIKEAPVPETYAADTVFGAAVRPVLEKHCLSCHGPDKQKGDYRMDSFAALLVGGKSGQPAIVPGDLMHSDLVTRLALDPTEEKVMPPRKKPRPTTAEIALLRWWIKQGAERDLPLTAAAKAPPEVSALLASNAANAAPAGEAPYVPKVGDYSALRPEIARLESSLGIKLVQVSHHAGDGLILRIRGAEAHFGDAELAQFTRIAPFIVEAELAGTQITDAGLVALKPFSHLDRLHLERTALTGATLGELRALPVLSYLNLCVTAVTDEAIAKLGTVTSLQQLYLFGSKVTPAGLDRLRTSLPRCNFGPLETPR
jgi:uncharacterized membrane protein